LNPLTSLILTSTFKTSTASDEGSPKKKVVRKKPVKKDNYDGDVEDNGQRAATEVRMTRGQLKTAVDTIDKVTETKSNIRAKKRPASSTNDVCSMNDVKIENIEVPVQKKRKAKKGSVKDVSLENGNLNGTEIAHQIKNELQEEIREKPSLKARSKTQAQSRTPLQNGAKYLNSRGDGGRGEVGKHTRKSSLKKSKSGSKRRSSLT